MSEMARAYARGADPMKSGTYQTQDDLVGEFDRWLAAHDAEVAARTLREAAEAYERGLHIDTIPKWLRDLAHDQAVDVTKITPGNRPN